ncbi:MAG: PD-(D/E)XK nuclease family protein [Candidatus Omnitrophica bacterium]|nr:PD-(D/E)XK nuclease family protein [Candidatus Omnitrophota bacterium]
MLETRDLNFKNVIIIEANESKLPALRKSAPLVPHEVTRLLGIDMALREEELQRHLFYRLLYSASSAHIIYEENSGKERSRFLEELVWHEEKRLGRIGAIEARRASFNAEIAAPGIEFGKTEEICEMLKKLRFSATSVNTYVECPLKFYYTYVMKLEEKEALTSDVEGNEIGIFIHELLEKSFTHFINKKPVINDDFRKDVLSSFEKQFKVEFAKKLGSSAFLLERVMRHRLESFLDFESERCREVESGVKEILYLEQKFKPGLKLSGTDFDMQYVVDRVDLLEDGSIFILDYKTGLDAHKPKATKKLENMEFTRASIKENIRSFQLPIYYYFEKEKYPEKNVNAALYGLRNPKLTYFIDKNVDIDRTMEICLKSLDYILHEIVDLSKTFARDNSDPESCRYCPYKTMCR